MGAVTQKDVGLCCNHGHLSGWVVTGDSTLNVGRVHEFACERKFFLFLNGFNHFTDGYAFAYCMLCREKQAHKITV